jgi:protein-tyrosine phosphatase
MGDWHEGQRPDERMQQAAQDRGVILSSRAKVFNAEYFEQFDYVLAADRDVLHELYTHAKSPEHKAKIHLITDYSESYRGQDIPDPYYAGKAGFETVLDMLEDSCEALAQYIYNKKLPLY